MKRLIIRYYPQLKDRARQLRNNSTQTEIILWNYLKGKQRLGFDFHRQKPLNRFIVDFYCNELFLAIEIDGLSHDGKYEFDKERQRRMECLGIKFLRFTDEQVNNSVERVVEIIDSWIWKHTPYPSQEGKIQKKTKPSVPSQEGKMHRTTHPSIPSREGKRDKGRWGVLKGGML